MSPKKRAPVSNLDNPVNSPLIAAIRKIAFGTWVALVALLLAYAVIAKPIGARQHARQHSAELWGDTLPGKLVTTSHVRASKDGAYNTGTYAFSNKFGETQTVKGDFRLNQVPKTITVWQQRLTARTFLPRVFDHDNDAAGPEKIGASDPIYTGNLTLIGWCIFGLIATILVSVISLIFGFAAVDEFCNFLLRRTYRRHKPSNTPA